MKEGGKVVNLIKIGQIIDAQPKRDHGNIANLKASIQEVGLINPLTVNQDFKLLAGRRRYHALKELGFKEVPIRILQSGNELFDFRVALIENIVRKNLSDPELAASIKEYDELKRKLEGEKNTKLKGKDSFGRHTVASEDGWTQFRTAQDLGMSRQAVTKAIKIATAIEEKPELIKHKKGSLILQRYEREKKIEEIKKGNKPLIGIAQKEYPILLADPPWRYEHPISESRAIEKNYPTMSLDEICALPVHKISAPDSVIFLWTTSPKLTEALSAMKVWGFEYRTSAVWIKNKIGMGYYFRQQHEFLLVGAKGNLSSPLPETRKSSVISFPRLSEHSKKPEMVYEIIEDMYPEYAKIELFAREKRKGWEAWGNELEVEEDEGNEELKPLLSKGPCSAYGSHPFNGS